MKIKKNVILEMADNRKRALDEVGNQQSALFEHIMKCVLYREHTNWLPDWYKTIGNICRIVNEITLKNGTKLKEKDYINELLSFDSIDDCDRKIRSFYLREIVTFHNYPQFIDRQNDPNLLYNIYSEFVIRLSKVVSTKNDYDNKYFANMFKEYFESKINDLEEDFDETNLFTLL